MNLPLLFTFFFFKKKALGYVRCEKTIRNICSVKMSFGFNWRVKNVFTIKYLLKIDSNVS